MGFLKGSADELTVRTTASLVQADGRLVKVPFKATFQRLSTPEREQVARDINEGARTQRDVIRDYIRGWHDLAGDDGEEVEFNTENLEFALSNPDYLDALTHAYMDAQSGKGVVNRATGKN